MLQWFETAHLPPHLKEVSAPFGELARRVSMAMTPGAETSTVLRKLLEAKDAAVRARMEADQTRAQGAVRDGAEPGAAVDGARAEFSRLWSPPSP